MTKLALTRIFAAVLLAGLGAAASAQNQPSPPAGGPGMMGPGAMGPGMMRDGGHHRFDPARMEQRRARHLTELKQKLQLTPGQESAWNTFAATMTPPAFQRPDPAQRAEFEKLTTPERIDRMRALRDRRMAEMDKRAEATKTFYAALTPEQKKVFDAESLPRRRGMRGMHGMHG